MPYLSDPSLLDDSPGAVASAPGTEHDATDRVGAAADSARTKQPQAPVVTWAKALILSAAVIFIGVFAWYAVDRFVGRKNSVINFSVLAGLIGMGTASAIISTGRSGATAKIMSALSALLAVVLAKALILCVGDLPPDLMRQPELADRLAELARLAFKPIDALFVGIAIIGSTIRFVLSEPDE